MEKEAFYQGLSLLENNPKTAKTKAKTKDKQPKQKKSKKKESFSLAYQGKIEG